VADVELEKKDKILPRLCIIHATHGSQAEDCFGIMHLKRCRCTGEVTLIIRKNSRACVLSPSTAYHNSCTMVSNDFKSNYGLESRTASGNAKPAIQTFI